MGKLEVEICADSIESAVIADNCNVDRIELCANLISGGTTPSYGLIKKVISRVNCPVHVLIRPRGGDFLYSEDEIDIMIEDIKACAALGAAGIVIGALDEKGKLDKRAMREFIEAAGDLDVSFHRAIDMCSCRRVLIQDLIHLGVKRILTSGGEANALLGIKELEESIRAGGKNIEIMAGAGINSSNIESFMNLEGLSAVHLSAKKAVKSSMVYVNENVNMGSVTASSEYEKTIADENVISKIIHMLGEEEDERSSC